MAVPQDMVYFRAGVIDFVSLEGKDRGCRGDAGRRVVRPASAALRSRYAQGEFLIVLSLRVYPDLTLGRIPIVSNLIEV
jgi:hypothetical protein